MIKERLNWMAAWMAMALLAISAIRYVPEVVTVSTSPDGRELPIYCVSTDKPQIALTFDAAWGNEDTRKILSILAEYQVKATFFMTGGWVDTYPEDVKAIQAAGHDLGNHSENHKRMTQLSAEEQATEILGVHKKVKELTGAEMELFRPPYGDYNNEVVRTAEENGYYAIQWSVDSLDWKDYGAEAIVQAVCGHKDLGNGAIILCHNGAKYTAQALPSMIENLQSQGYQLVPVSQLIYRENFHMDQNGKQIPEN